MPRGFRGCNTPTFGDHEHETALGSANPPSSAGPPFLISLLTIDKVVRWRPSQCPRHPIYHLTRPLNFVVTVHNKRSPLITTTTSFSQRSHGFLVAGRRGAKRVPGGQVPGDRSSGRDGHVLRSSLPGQDPIPRHDKQARSCEKTHKSWGAVMGLELTSSQPTLPHSFLFGHLIAVGKALAAYPADL